MADIYFACPKCGNIHAIEDAGVVGQTIQCSECKDTIRIPQPDIRWTCNCGSAMAAPAALARQRIRCADCQKSVMVPSPALQQDDTLPNSQPPIGGDVEKPKLKLSNPQSQGDSTLKCPHCAKPMEKDAVLCTACGFNTLTGKTVTTQMACQQLSPKSIRQTIVISAVIAVIALLFMFRHSLIPMFGRTTARTAASITSTPSNSANTIIPVLVVPTNNEPIAELTNSTEEQLSVDDYTPRNLRWGMSTKEVIAKEGPDCVKQTPTTLMYAVETAGLPSLVLYQFEENKLVKASICFADPRMGRLLPEKSSMQAEKDFSRITELLSKKYGHAEMTTNSVSYLKQLEQRVETFKESLDSYERQREDISRKREQKRDDLQEHYRGWKSPQALINKDLEYYDAELRRNNEWQIELRRNIQDAQKAVEKEREIERSGKRKAQVIGHWYSTGLYDIYLTLTYLQNGVQIAATYNGVMSKNVINIPSQL